MSMNNKAGIVPKILPAIVTPYKNGKIDIKSLHKHLKFLKEDGIEELVVMGSTGEGVGVDYQIFEEMLNETVSFGDKHFKVFVSVANPHKNSVKNFVKIAEDRGAYGLMLNPPFTAKARQQDVLNMFEFIDSITDLPIIIYNNVARFGVNIEVDLYKELIARFNVYGVKECAAPDSNVWLELKKMKDSKSFFILAGDDDNYKMLYDHDLVDGCVSVLANCFPRAALDLYKAGESFQNLWKKAAEMFGITASPLHVKYFLSKMGLCEMDTGYFFVDLTNDEMKQLDALFDSVKILN